MFNTLMLACHGCLTLQSGYYAAEQATTLSNPGSYAARFAGVSSLAAGIS